MTSFAIARRSPIAVPIYTVLDPKSTIAENTRGGATMLAMSVVPQHFVGAFLTGSRVSSLL